MREGQKSLLAEEQLKKEQVQAAVQQQQQLVNKHQEEINKQQQRSSSSDSFSKDDRDSPILNLSSKHDMNNSDLSGDDDVYVSDNDDEDLASNEDTKKIGQDHGDKSEDKVNNNGTSAVPSQVNS